MIFNLTTTLTGTPGTGIVLDLPGGVLASYLDQSGYVTTYCVGSTGDPALQGDAWAARDFQERAEWRRVFGPRRKCLACGQAEGHAVSLKECRKAYLRTL